MTGSLAFSLLLGAASWPPTEKDWPKRRKVCAAELGLGPLLRAACRRALAPGGGRGTGLAALAGRARSRVYSWLRADYSQNSEMVILDGKLRGTSIRRQPFATSMRMHPENMRKTLLVVAQP
jgi:hypothetical protein